VGVFVKIGFAQVLVAHVELLAVKHPDVVIDGIFERIEQSMTIDRVSVGVTPDLAATWFRFTGELHE
jgi:hypothetical protein